LTWRSTQCAAACIPPTTRFTPRNRTPFATNALDGGKGNDVLTGGGSDKFVFSSALKASSNVDLITDFEVGNERIVLDNAIFTLVGPEGGFADKAFASNLSGTAAGTALVRIVDDQ